jgi:hypothetical protein
MTYKIELVLDPPKLEGQTEPVDYVRIDAHSSDKESLEWLKTVLNDRIVFGDLEIKEMEK